MGLGFLASLCVSSFAALPQVAPLFQASVGLPDVKVDHVLEIGPLDANDEEMRSLTLWSPLVLFFHNCKVSSVGPDSLHYT